MRTTTMIALSAMVLATAAPAQTVFAGSVDQNSSRSNESQATACKAPTVWNAAAKKCVTPAAKLPVKLDNKK